MNWEAIAAVSGMISSIAVVGSLLYLAVQVKQSNRFTQSQTRAEIRSMAENELYRIIEYPELWQGMYSPELTEEQRLRMHTHLLGALRFREFIWRQYQLDLLDKTTFLNYSRALLMILATPRTRAWWDIHQQHLFDPAYVSFVNELLDSQPAVDPQQSLQGW